MAGTGNSLKLSTNSGPNTGLFVPQGKLKADHYNRVRVANERRIRMPFASNRRKRLTPRKKSGTRLMQPHPHFSS